MTSRQTVVKRIEFPAGHRLMNYNGKCKNLHGHSFVAEVCLGADQLDGMGLVIDFTDVGRFLKTWIDQNWDHAFIVNNDDKKLLEFLLVNNLKVYALRTGEDGENPSVENLSKHMYKILYEEYSSHPGLIIEYVDIWESSSSYARFTYERAQRVGMIKDNRGDD